MVPNSNLQNKCFKRSLASILVPLPIGNHSMNSLVFKYKKYICNSLHFYVGKW